ncbi:MAG: VWA domain-containing protein [gamma proteobacterium symbiont of Bathyaustriella thionipta]|nr:VWA domain-containing protein [gamma proteobacterium symbiont of Bathyaustriella thionipta]
MSEAGFQFAHPGWLLLLAMPLLVGIWLRLTRARDDMERYRAYADEQLLPYLLARHGAASGRRWQRPLWWSLLWILLVLALAGPRWDFHDIQLFRPGNDLVILLDLSASMDVKDVAPSRLLRAHQEIQDLIEYNHQARLGLIAFASRPHVVTPLTQDGASLRLQLPALTTKLLTLRGSRPGEALLRAGQMLAGQPADSGRHVLLITDGDFADDQSVEIATQMAEKNIHLHVFGVGSAQGGEVAGLRRRDGQPILSALNEAALEALAKAGKGLYRLAGYQDSDTRDLLNFIDETAHAQVLAQQKTRVWNERFYYPIGILMLLLLPVFRRTWKDASA